MLLIIFVALHDYFSTSFSQSSELKENGSGGKEVTMHLRKNHLATCS